MGAYHDLVDRPAGQIPVLDDHGGKVERYLMDRDFCWCNIDQHLSAHFEQGGDGSMIVNTSDRTHIVPKEEVELLKRYDMATTGGRQFWLWREQEVRRALNMAVNEWAHAAKREARRNARARGVDDWNPHATA
jgi:hypothetical protein